MSLTRFSLPGGTVNGPATQLGGGMLFNTGKAVYVNSTLGSNDNVGSDPSLPKASLAGAQAAAAASKDDVVIVARTHAETVTAAIALSKAGVSYFGLGENLGRPTITASGAIDAVNVTGANITIDNFVFPFGGVDDATSDINIAAAGVTVRNTYHIGSTTSINKTDMITITSAGHDFIIEGSRFYNTVVDCVSAISIEGAVARGVVRGNTIQGTFSTSCLMDEATATLLTIEGNMFKNTKTTGTTFNFTNNSTGVMRFNHNSGRNTTLASNYVLGTGMDYFENRLVEEAALNGGIFPVADSD